MQAVYVLWLRQVIRYLRSRARIIGSLGQPLLFLLALGYGFGPIYEKAGGGDYIQFIAPGIIAMAVLFTSVFTGIEVIWDRQFGFLKETLVAPVTRFEIMLGRTLGGATIALIQGTLVFVAAVLVGFRPELSGLPLAFAYAFLTAVFFTAVGTAIASVLDDLQGFQLIMNFLVMPTFFLSGALFPLSGLPPAISAISSVNPLAYGVDGLRGALINSSHFSLATDFAALSIATAVALALANHLFEKIQA